MSFANLPQNVLIGISNRLTDPFNKASLRTVSQTAADSLLPAQQDALLRRMTMLLSKMLQFRGSRIEISDEEYEIHVRANRGPPDRQFSMDVYRHGTEETELRRLSAGQVLRRVSHIVNQFSDRVFTIMFDYSDYHKSIMKARDLAGQQFQNWSNFLDGSAGGISLFASPNYNLVVAPWLQSLTPLVAPNPRVRKRRTIVPVNRSRVRRRLELAPIWNTPVLGHQQMLAQLNAR